MVSWLCHLHTSPSGLAELGRNVSCQEPVFAKWEETFQSFWNTELPSPVPTHINSG